MLSKRIIPCLDVRDGKTTKGIKFKGNVDIGDPVEMARFYYEAGADELVFYDITASAEGRDIMLEVVAKVAATIFIPFSVGGGIKTVEEMRAVLLAGAEKVSLNSPAVNNPEAITQGAKAFGSQCIVVGMDVKKVAKTAALPSGYEIYINGGRKPMGHRRPGLGQKGPRPGSRRDLSQLHRCGRDPGGLRDGADLHDLRGGLHPGDRLGRGRGPGTLRPGLEPGQGRRGPDRLHDPLRNLHRLPDQGNLRPGRCQGPPILVE